MAVSFGKLISTARKKKDMSQKDLAKALRREDGEPLSPQYLNDIEHDRRSPSGEVIVQLAKVLQLNADYLHFLAKKWPEDLAADKVKPEQVEKLMLAFRKALDK